MNPAPSPGRQKPAEKGVNFPPRYRRRLGLLLFLGLICVVAAVAAREHLYRVPAKHSSPPQRQHRNAPFITSPAPVVQKMVELAKLTEQDTVFDLGCGDGRLVVAAVRESGCWGVGFDIDPERVAEARANVRRHDLQERVDIKQADIFKVDFSKADVVMAYLLPWMMNDLVPQFNEMAPGSLVITHDFWIDCVEPKAVVKLEMNDAKRSSHSIYVYETPLKTSPYLEKGRPPAPTVHEAAG